MPRPPKIRHKPTNRGTGPAWQVLNTYRLPDDICDTSLILKKGHLLVYFLEHEKSRHYTNIWATRTFGITVSMGQMLYLQKRAEPLMKHAQLDKLRILCDETVLVNPSSATVHQSTHHNSVEVSSFAAGDAGLDPHGPVPTLPQSHVPNPPPSATYPPIHNMTLRSNKWTEREKKMKKRILVLQTSLRQRTSVHREKMRQLRYKLARTPADIKQLKQKLKRRDNKVLSLKTQVKRNVVEDKKKVNRAVKQQKKESIRETEMKFQKQIKEKDETILALQDRILILEEEIEELKQHNDHDTEAASKENKKAYSDTVRKIVFDAVSAGVATGNVRSLVENISERLGKKLIAPRSRSTIEQMARELGAISDLQAAEVAMGEKNLTMGFDATTQDGNHINAIHLTTKTKTVSVAIDQLPGGTAEDYADHIDHSIDHLTAVYSNFHDADYRETKQTIINNISSTMTDRAAVNHCTIKKVENRWQKSLNELNCNLHPLDSIATSCRSAARAVEKEKSSLFGKDCVAGNIAVAMDKFRYKDNKGDPRSFKNFLRSVNKPTGLLPRYRGNRLHVFFHLCGIFVQFYELFLQFLTTTSVSCGGLRDSLKEAFQSQMAFREMCVFGLIGKLFTGPWMTKFYVNSEADISHVDAIKMIKAVTEEVTQAAKTPGKVFQRTTDFFGGEVNTDSCFIEIQRVCPRDEQAQDLMRLCLASIIGVIDRQYKKYFTSDDELLETLEAETESARLHNMDAEEYMGMISAAQKRAPSATTEYNSAKIRAKKNCTVEYVDNLDDERQHRTIRWAINIAGKKRKLTRLKQSQVLDEIAKREKAKQQKKEEKQRKEIEKLLREIEIENLASKMPDLEGKAVEDISEILLHKAVGRNMVHLWYDAVEQTYETYHGRFEKVKQKKDSFIYTVAYWKEKGESYEENAEDFVLDQYQLAADVVCGDLFLV